MSSREDRMTDALAEQQDDTAWRDHWYHHDLGRDCDKMCVVCLRDRTPHRGDSVLLYNERRTILDLIDRGSGLLVVADDEAGLRIERYADRLVWDDDARAWRGVA